MFCRACRAPLSKPLHFKTELRPCGSCLSVTRVTDRRWWGEEMTGARQLRLREALGADPSLQRTLAHDPERHWQLQLPLLRENALLRFQDADEVRLIRDAQVMLRRPRSGRNWL